LTMLNQKITRIGDHRSGALRSREPAGTTPPTAWPIPGTGLDGAADRLGELLGRYDGDPRRALAAYNLLTHGLGVAESLELLAAADGDEGDLERASLLLGAAAAQRASLAALLRVADPNREAKIPGRSARLPQPDPGTWARGQVMSLGEVVGQVLAPVVQRGPRAVACSSSLEAELSIRLTPRESEVADLIARGCSNHQIADELVLSVRTVERHIENIYAKLGVGGKSGRAVIAYNVQRPSRAPERTVPRPL
jgi:DNA-binding CsgD family transcriptional regulator